MNDKRSRIERGMKFVARCVADGGTVYLPIFERLERELAAFDRTESAIERAKRMAGKG